MGLKKYFLYAKKFFHMIYMEKVYKYSRKFLEKDLKENKEYSLSSTNEKIDKQKVFVLWLQGFENAPDIVKMCHKNLQIMCEKMNLDLIDLSEENYKEYITLPDFVLELFQKGKITRTFLSDLIRLELLLKYGGVWIDSTCLLTREIPKEILEADLFFFKYGDDVGRLDSLDMSSWFVVAKKNNKVLLSLKNALYNSIKKEKKNVDYFLFHKMLLNVVAKFFEHEYSAIPLFSGNPSKFLVCMLFEDMNNKNIKKNVELVLKNTFIHKLRYSFTKEEFEKENTVYKYLLDTYFY